MKEKMLKFYKYEGAGNDFILTDDRQQSWNPSAALISRLCDRHFGIGADGLIRIIPSETGTFGMVYYNADGLESTMCGNGGRCAAAFAFRQGGVAAKMHFNASDGLHEAEVIEQNGSRTLVRLQMQDTQPARDFSGGFFIDTGSPHFVVLCEDPDAVDVASEGKRIRHDPGFGPGGTNVNFLTIQNTELRVRTFERGVEAETLACGTGVTACALVAGQLSGISSGCFNIQTRGGQLSVTYERQGDRFTDIRLKGPADYVFEGLIDLNQFPEHFQPHSRHEP